MFENKDAESRLATLNFDVIWRARSFREHLSRRIWTLSPEPVVGPKPCAPTAPLAPALQHPQASRLLPNLSAAKRRRMRRNLPRVGPVGTDALSPAAVARILVTTAK